VTAFRRTRSGVLVSFDDTEVSLLRHLVGEVRHLLDDGATGAEPAGGADELVELTGLVDVPAGGPAPELSADPVLARLLPDGYGDDAGAAAEFRRLTEATLRREKLQTADLLLADLPATGAAEVRLDPETTERWLVGLNDVRLALGTRLDVQEDMPEPDPEDPDAPAYVVYLWLTELQGVLIELADGG
jgi:hypothetical protein